MTLPTVAELATSAAHCAAPVMLWAINLDLIVTARAGQLAALSPTDNTGSHIFDVIGSDDPIHPNVQALRRAFLGEVVNFTTTMLGHTWDATYAPIVDHKRIWGVIGSACLASAPRGTNPEQPFVYRCTQDVLGFRVGEILTRPRHNRGTIRRHDDVSVEDFDWLMTLHALTPVPSVAAYEADERCAEEADDSARRLPRGFLRLHLA